MGATHVKVTVRNPAAPEREWEGLFLVDTGSIDCLVPGRYLDELGFARRATRAYELADGSPLTMSVAAGQLEFLGNTIGATLIFGPDEAEPILGLTALESAGIEVDPRNGRLKQLPATRLK